MSILIAILLIGAALRVGGAGGELWMDEIWSLQIATNAQTPADIFTQRHDNNHLLNTAYLYLVGEGAPQPAYRGLAIFSGLASLLLAVWVSRRWGAMCAMGFAAMIAVSHLFVVYGSEARGYGPAVAMTLLAFGALIRHIEHPRRSTAALFAITCIVGLLAHFTFAYFMVAAITWSCALWWRHGRWKMLLTESLQCHAAPLVAATALYIFFIKDITIGRGPEVSAWEAVGDLAASLLGMPRTGWWPWLAVAIAVFPAVAGLIVWRRTDARAAWFALLAGFICPAAMVIILRPPFLYPRYMLLACLFMFLSWAHLFAFLWRQRSWHRAAAVALLALFVASNIPDNARLITHGRGRHQAMLRYVMANTADTTVAIGSNHDLSMHLCMQLACNYVTVPTDHRLRLIAKANITQAQPQWLCIVGWQRNLSPSAYVTAGALRYNFDRLFQCDSVSGLPLTLYRRHDP